MIVGMSRVTLSNGTIETDHVKSAIFTQKGANEPTRALPPLQPEEMADKKRALHHHPRTKSLNKAKIDTLSITTFKGALSVVTGESAEKDASALERAGFPVERRMKSK